MKVTSVLPLLPSISDPGVVVALLVVVTVLVVVGLDRLVVERLVIELVELVVLEGAGAELTIVALRRGVESSSRIVPRPLPSASVALTWLESRTPIVSSFSFVVSPITWTVMVFVVSPAAKESVPDAVT